MSSKKQHVFEFIKDVESNIHKIPEVNDRDQLRHSIISIASNYLKEKSHITEIDRIIANNIRETNMFVKNNSDLFFTRADKGNITVIMKKDEYKMKVFELLDDEKTYKEIENNPEQNFKKDTFKILEKRRTKYFLGNVRRKDILNDNTNIARFYGLPKIHKNNYPLRPVVSSINSPAIYLAKLLNNILTKALPKQLSLIKNSQNLIHILSNVAFPENHIMISLDVTSLFTNVPTQLVLKGIDKRWPIIQKLTKLPIDELKKGINFLMDSTHLKIDNKYYKQIFGTPMGSPISPIIADIVMQDLEEEIIKKQNFTVPLYYRYVDDTILFIPKDKINNKVDEFNK